MASAARPDTIDPEAEAFELGAYLARIGFTGSARPDLETLRTLHRLHPAAIAFENLDPFLGRPVDLDPALLQEKLVGSRRGGYCFEQNLLFMRALRAVGFDVSGLAARVTWSYPPDALTPRGHMLLRVEIDGETRIADVGFGGLTLTAPLVLETGVEQDTPHERFRLVEEDGYFVQQALLGGEWRSVYRFDLSEHHPVDYGVTSYYLSTNPGSHFVNGLIAARALPERRIALSGNRFAVHYPDGRTERRELDTPAELAALLEQEFDIAPPDRAAFEQMAARKLDFGD